MGSIIYLLGISIVISASRLFVDDGAARISCHAQCGVEHFSGIEKYCTITDAYTKHC